MQKLILGTRVEMFSIYSNLSTFRDEASEIKSENEGVVVKIKDTYGFISNAKHIKCKAYQMQSIPIKMLCSFQKIMHMRVSV